jgi:hypothetical protein
MLYLYIQTLNTHQPLPTGVGFIEVARTHAKRYAKPRKATQGSF